MKRTIIILTFFMTGLIVFCQTTPILRAMKFNVIDTSTGKISAKYNCQSGYILKFIANINQDSVLVMADMNQDVDSISWWGVGGYSENSTLEPGMFCLMKRCEWNKLLIDGNAAIAIARKRELIRLESERKQKITDSLNKVRILKILNEN